MMRGRLRKGSVGCWMRNETGTAGDDLALAGWGQGLRVGIILRTLRSSFL